MLCESMKSKNPTKKPIIDYEMKTDRKFYTGGTRAGRLSNREMLHQEIQSRPRLDRKAGPVPDLVMGSFADIERRVLAAMVPKIVQAILDQAARNVVGKAIERLREQIDEEGCGAVIATLNYPLV